MLGRPHAVQVGKEGNWRREEVDGEGRRRNAGHRRRNQVGLGQSRIPGGHDDGRGRARRCRWGSRSRERLPQDAPRRAG